MCFRVLLNWGPIMDLLDTHSCCLLFSRVPRSQSFLLWSMLYREAVKSPSFEIFKRRLDKNFPRVDRKKPQAPEQEISPSTYISFLCYWMVLLGTSWISAKETCNGAAKFFTYLWLKELLNRLMQEGEGSSVSLPNHPVLKTKSFKHLEQEHQARVSHKQVNSYSACPSHLLHCFPCLWHDSIVCAGAWRKRADSTELSRVNIKPTFPSIIETLLLF